MWPFKTLNGDSETSRRLVRAAEKPGIIPTVKLLVQQPPWMAGVPKMQGALFSAELIELDLNVDSGRQLELHQRIDGFVRRINDIHEPLMRQKLVLIACVLVGVRRYQDRIALDLRRKRHGTLHGCARSLGRLDDLTGRLVDEPV